MRHLLAVMATVALLAGPALAFNNLACGGFLVGTWKSEATESRGAKTIVLNANGLAVVTEELRADENGKVISAPPRAGHWSAGPGEAADECAIETRAELKTMTGTIKVIDDNTIAIRETRYTRQ